MLNRVRYAGDSARRWTVAQWSVCVAIATLAAIYLFVGLIVDGAISRSKNPAPEKAVVATPDVAPVQSESLLSYRQDGSARDADQTAQQDGQSDAKNFYGFKRFEVGVGGSWSMAGQQAAASRASYQSRAPSPQSKAKTRKVTFDATRTYKTVCVRMCDGYFFPLSQSVTPDKFKIDAGRCQAQCGAPSRLYVVPTDRLATEADPDMTSLTGDSYSDLSTAYVYRTRYQAGCRCKAQPWTMAATKRHKKYAVQDTGPITKRLIAVERARMDQSRQRAKLALSEKKSLFRKRRAKAKRSYRRKARLAVRRRSAAKRRAQARKFDAPMRLGAGHARHAQKIERHASRSFYRSRGRRTTREIFRANFMGGVN